MKLIVTVLAVMLGLLSIAAGVAKIALIPEEVKFLSQFGFTNTLAICFGIVQSLSGFLLFIPVTRLYGALIAAAGFALSAGLVLTSGNVVFAGVSLVPFMLAGFVAYRSCSGRLSANVS